MCTYVFQSKWVNKQRVLIFSSRGITFWDRHLMLDFRKIMPHSKSGMSTENQTHWNGIECQLCIWSAVADLVRHGQNGLKKD